MAELHVTAETATVYRAGYRRFLTKRAAYKAAAREDIASEDCHCEQSDAENHCGGYPCDLHRDGAAELHRLAAIRAAKYQAEDRELLRQTGGDDANEA